ncbi:DEAD/DEAH box helicase [Adhaeribacter radiodurans]|uniref:DEAD/DEAH box helicase n=1 Tax=Adhaeribacter radiodurans TaxID=2745197 RepID=A0A7L7LEM7_9BACT|nr:DEAD/DEAH box helicase [Adhaeribacter radiodurans]QMU31281.1 DEAD/DEAH box helicase [Adhaeribacter radiodurans]
MEEKEAAPTITFEDFKLNRQLLNAVADAGYTTPTPVQQQTIPLITAGHDVMGVAQTGTGKTAAYLLPLLMKVKYAQGLHPRAIILSPTRELAMQIEESIRQLAKYTDLRFLAIYGGIGPKTQIEQIKKGLDILVATPGRLMEIYLKGDLVLKELKTLVLDEADKMMDMGFMPQIRSILEVIPRKRQNLLFSATMHPRLENLTAEFLEFPMKIEVTPSATPVETVSQVLYQIPNMQTKLNMLRYLFKDEETFTRVILFTRSKTNAEKVAAFVDDSARGTVRVIHGNKGQNTRINAMDAFRSGEVRFLVATDVASRGIDISGVSHVINVDVPIIYEDYVHRIGRTGRAEQEGASIIFATEAEMHHIREIEKIINMAIPEEPLPTEVEIAKTKFAEGQEMAKEIDKQKRRANPDFKGAFHEKKQHLHEGVIDKRTGKPFEEKKPTKIRGFRRNKS